MVENPKNIDTVLSQLRVIHDDLKKLAANQYYKDHQIEALVKRIEELEAVRAKLNDDTAQRFIKWGGGIATAIVVLLLIKGFVLLLLPHRTAGYTSQLLWLDALLLLSVFLALFSCLAFRLLFNRAHDL